MKMQKSPPIVFPITHDRKTSRKAQKVGSVWSTADGPADEHCGLCRLDVEHLGRATYNAAD